MSDTDRYGGYGPPVFFNDAERAFASCLVLRGHVEAKVNDDEPFPCYRPLSYTVVDGTTYDILVQVSDPGQNPPPHVFPEMVKMEVYWGPPQDNPVLTHAWSLVTESSETQSRTTNKSGVSPGNSSGSFDEIDRTYSYCLALRGQVQEMLKRTFPNFKPISYQAQVVKGMNYKIRVDVGDKQQGCLILKTIIVMTVYWDLPPSIPRVTDVNIVNEPPGYCENKAFANDKSQKPSGDGAYGETVDFNRDPVSERAYMSAFMLRGQVEEKLNKGKPFSSYRPISYQAEMIWFEGMNFKIRIDVTPPLDWPPWDGIGPVILQTYVEITVHLGLLHIPELKGAKILKPNSM